MKMKGLDSREISSLPKNENLVDMAHVISTITEKNCMLITRLIGRDDICNDVITLGKCFSMFGYIHARFRFTLIGGNLTA